jgi:hypothetical protein
VDPTPKSEGLTRLAILSRRPPQGEEFARLTEVLLGMTSQLSEWELDQRVPTRRIA